MENKKLIENLKIWIQAARPKTLPAAAAPVLVGLAAAYRVNSIDINSAIACLMVSLLMQIAANFANDLFDHVRGSDTPDRLGPVRVTAAGLISVDRMKIAVILTISFAGLFGIYLIWVRGLIIFILGILIIFAALLYTGGPFPYGYYALGDIFVFLSFGLAAVCGTYFVQTGLVNWTAVTSSIPVGLLIVNVLVVNNTRDIGTDKAVNKRTIAVLLGRKAMIAEFFICLAASYATPFFMIIFNMSSAGVLLSLFSLPLAFFVSRDFITKSGKDLNGTLAKTAQLALVYSLLFAAGMVIFPG